VPSQETRKDIAIGATLQRRPPHATRERGVANFYLPEYLQNARRLGIGDAAGSAIEEADHAHNLRTSGRGRGIGDYLADKRPICSRDQVARS
jgi:hypothetical protein